MSKPLSNTDLQWVLQDTRTNRTQQLFIHITLEAVQIDAHLIK